MRMVTQSDGEPLPKFPTFRGTGLRPGVDLDDSAALLDLMEERRSVSGSAPSLRR